MDYDSINAFLEAVTAVGDSIKDKSILQKMESVRDDAKTRLEAADERYVSADKLMQECSSRERALVKAEEAVESSTIEAERLVKERKEKNTDLSRMIEDANVYERQSEAGLDEREEAILSREKALEIAEIKLSSLNIKATLLYADAEKQLKDSTAKLDALRLALS